MRPGDILSHAEMTIAEKVSLQRGMNYQVNQRGYSIVLMSVRENSPYADRVIDEGKTIIYEGHDVQINHLQPGQYAKGVDQPMLIPSGALSANGKFYKAAHDFKAGKRSPEIVKIYEKIKSNIWVYNGKSYLTDAFEVEENGRKVFKFKLEIFDSEDEGESELNDNNVIEHARFIPSHVKAEVWKRDQGKCITCGSSDNLHYDHIVPYSKGGTSLSAENIQLLCLRHNLSKSNKII